MATSEDAGPVVADGIVWDAEIPVLTNLFLWWEVGRLFLIVWVVVVALMGAIFLATGDPASVVPIAGVFALVCPALVVFSMLVASARYLNRIRVRFALSAEGVRYQTLERGDSVLNRLAVVLGLFSGRPATAGAGLLAEARKTEFISWNKVTRVREHETLLAVTLIQGRRVVQRLHCHRDNYRSVVAFVRSRVG